jgi:hypothetical protein
MTAALKTAPDLPQTVDTYLGFEIRKITDDAFVAFPLGWTHRDVTLLEAPNLPTLRKRVWAWWHRLLD